MKNRSVKFHFPHSYVIIISVLLLACVLTYLIPAGQFERFQNENGITVIDPNTFSYIENSPVALWRVPEQIMASAAKNAAAE